MADASRSVFRAVLRFEHALGVMDSTQDSVARSRRRLARSQEIIARSDPEAARRWFDLRTERAGRDRGRYDADGPEPGVAGNGDSDR